MEVSGSKGTKDQKKTKPCKVCVERNISTYADGVCKQCSEHMCKACFDTHRQFKFNRSHHLVKTDVATCEQLEEYVLCDKHSCESIKFFCPHHDQVGCGDCIILDHKTCKVEYIRDILNAYQESKEYKQFRQDIETCSNDVKRMKTSINNIKDQIKNVNEEFKRDVNKFKDELISHIIKMANSLLKCGDDIMMSDVATMDSLEKENERIIGETTGVQDTLRSLTDQPYKTFITSTECRKTLDQIKDKLNNNKGKKNFEIYTFKNEESFKNLLQNDRQIGHLQKKKQIHETAIGVVSVDCPENVLPISKGYLEGFPSDGRLSFPMENKLGDSNPYRTYQFDICRPTKIAEKHSELFDNEWTDAYDGLLDYNNFSEERIIKTLLTMLQDVKTECDKISEDQELKLKEAITLKSSCDDLPDYVYKELKDFRRVTFEVSLPETIEKCLLAVRLTNYHRYLNHRVLKYFELCVELCWLMNISDPLLVFGDIPRKNDQFDSNTFKFYSCMGSRYDYIVWPALLLKTDGSLLNKGVAQGC